MCAHGSLPLPRTHVAAGKWAGRSVIFFQQIASLGNNVTLGIVAGITMKVRAHREEKVPGLECQQLP